MARTTKRIVVVLMHGGGLDSEPGWVVDAVLERCAGTTSAHLVEPINRD